MNAALLDIMWFGLAVFTVVWADWRWVQHIRAIKGQR